jgi:Fe2+ or Zn2+ uptake regulation protein
VGKAHFSLTTQNFCQRIICDQTGKELWLADPELTRAIEAFCQKHGFDLSEYTLLAQGRCATAVKRRGGAPEAAVASMAG